MKIGSVLMGLLLVSGLAAGAIPQIERDALIALYNSTDGANWEDNSRWLNADGTDFNHPGTECYWYRVKCDAENLTVTEIRMYENDLSGSIPPELENLSNLTKLDLSYNRQLGGRIPSSLGNLSNLTELHLYDNNLSGSIPPELGALSNLTELHLYGNNLSGSIPPELGNLSSLVDLFLLENQLSGIIPLELGNLSNLVRLGLGSNQLRGNIPPELGNLPNLGLLYLYNNQLSGSIPPELGNLNLGILLLDGNKLSGSIPPELGNLSNLFWLNLSRNNLSGRIPSALADLPPLWQASIGYNALWTDDPAVQAYFDAEDPDWDETQTIAPEGLTVVSVGDHTVWLEWTPITFIKHTGGYEVFFEPSVLRTAASGGFTSTKSDSTFPVTGLKPGQSFDFMVRTFTNPNRYNQNTVVSEPTLPEMATTSDLGCAEPIVESGSGMPRTLTVTSTHDTYLWSTGETTSSIIVSPSISTYYWVRTTGPGSCDEATVVYVPTEVFADGFESGDTSGWSSHVP